MRIQAIIPPITGGRGAKNRDRGSVMVMALILTALLIALLGTVAANQHVALGAVQVQLRERRAESAARSALARALATLQDVDTNKVTLQDDWATLGGESATEVFSLGNDGVSYRVQIIDASGLININTALEAQLAQLPLTPEESDSLLDWRETNATSARASGAKDDFYDSLQTPYNAKLERLDTLSELLQVRGWTAATLYTPQTEPVGAAELPEDADGNPLALASLLTVESAIPNTRADGSARVNLAQTMSVQALGQIGINGLAANLIAAGGPAQSFAQLLARPGTNGNAAQQLLDGATFTTDTRTEGKINVNTAPEAVLKTIPGVTPDVAAARCPRQDAGCPTLGERSSVPGLAGAALGQVADSVGIGSDTFLVRAWGESGGVGVAFQATVQLTDGAPQVIGLERLPDASVPGWWSWTAADETTDATGAAL